MKTTEIIKYEDLRKTNLEFFDEFKESFNDTLESGWYILGKNVTAFEEEFAAYCGVKHCVGVASGLDALMLAVKAFDFPPGSEILVPSNTYIATILAILQNGLKPVLVEPELATYNMDPEALQSAITPNTVAVMVVHLYGKMCNMEAIKAITDKADLRLFEDCAQAHGASYKGVKAGNWGDAAGFSFYPTKNLGCLGDGGALTTNDDNVMEKVKKLRNYGSSKKYYNEFIGYNSRLDEVQAAFLRVKLKSLDKINNHKRNLAKIYLENLSDNLILPVVDEENYHDVYHIFNVRVDGRDKLKEALLESGVQTEIHYPVAPNKQVACKGMFPEAPGSYPISELIHGDYT